MRTLHLIPLLISASLLPPAAVRVALAAPRATAFASSALPCRIGMRCKPVHRQICGMRGIKRPVVRRRDAADRTAYAIDLDFRRAYGRSRAEVAPGSLACIVRRPPVVRAQCRVENNGGTAYGYVAVVARIDAPRQATGLPFDETLYVDVYGTRQGRVSVRVSVP